jgi:hypothetical protein
MAGLMAAACGPVEFTTSLPGARPERLKVTLHEGLQVVTVGVTIGPIARPIIDPATGKWPLPLAGCSEPIVRAVSIYGQHPPRFAAMALGGEFSFKNIEPGRYVLAPVGPAGACQVRPLLATIEKGEVRFDDQSP